MRKFWQIANIIYEKAMLAVFVTLLLIIFYAGYDTWYVFNNAGEDSYLRYRPDGSNASDIDNSPITSDMVGWITVDGTNIDYPVMQGEDNSMYLNLNPYGEYSLSGSIFLDSRNSSEFTDPYSIIYGHHMEYGMMFGALDDFLDDAYLDSHRTGELIVGRTGDKTYRIEIFYATEADAKDEIIFDPSNSGELIRYLGDAGFETDKRIISLTTCAGDVSSTRTVVFAYILENG